VPVAGSRKFVALAREAGKGKQRIELQEAPGEHGFDGDLNLEDEQWLKDALSFIEEAWLS